MFCFTNLLCLKVNGLWNRRASSLPFFPATAISKIPEAYLWGCAHGGCLTVALPATRETANQSKGLLFCNAPDKIFFRCSLSKGGKWEKSYIYYRQSFPLRSWFQRRAGQPHRLPVLPRSLLLAHWPLPPAAMPFQSCRYSWFCRLAEPRGTHLDGMKGKKENSKSP